jgi:para-aminobenzoate synthetase component 1
MKTSAMKEFVLPFAIHPEVLINDYSGTVAWLNSNSEESTSFLAMGSRCALELHDTDEAFRKIQSFYNSNSSYLFGFLGYDLKNDLEELSSENKSLVSMPEAYFFVPEIVLQCRKDATIVTFIDENCDAQEWESRIYEARALQLQQGIVFGAKKQQSLHVNTLGRDLYLERFQSIMHHILRGDTYEVNLCIPFSMDEIAIDPLELFLHYNSLTQAPFSVFFRAKEYAIISGSPERFLKKEGTRVFSQPMKGTIQRGKSSTEDLLLHKKLMNDRKEQAENIMIVDLVRNDLSRFAKKGSVKVEELCGVYQFKSVHQLISTVSCEVDVLTHPIDIIKKTFPMGSMTGAPKLSTMQIIEENERFKRGAYSGAFGYFTPNGDFDFNVLIRSFFYNSKEKSISFPVGGAITSLTDGNREFEECQLKAKAMLRAIQQTARIE